MCRRVIKLYFRCQHPVADRASPRHREFNRCEQFKGVPERQISKRHYAEVLGNYPTDCPDCMAEVADRARGLFTGAGQWQDPATGWVGLVYYRENEPVTLEQSPPWFREQHRDNVRALEEQRAAAEVRDQRRQEQQMAVQQQMAAQQAMEQQAMYAQQVAQQQMLAQQQAAADPYHLPTPRPAYANLPQHPGIGHTYYRPAGPSNPFIAGQDRQQVPTDQTLPPINTRQLGDRTVFAALPMAAQLGGGGPLVNSIRPGAPGSPIGPITGSRGGRSPPSGNNAGSSSSGQRPHHSSSGRHGGSGSGSKSGSGHHHSSSHRRGSDDEKDKHGKRRG